MIEVEPDLPEPPTEPTAFFADPADRSLVQRRLLTCRVEIDYTQKSVCRREHVLNAVKERVKAWNLRYVA